MMRVSFILQAVNRASGPIAVVTRTMEKLGTATAVSAGTATRAMERMNAGSASLARSMGATGAAARAATGRIGGYVAALRRASIGGMRGIGGRFMGAYDFGRDAAFAMRGRIGEEGLARAGRSIGYLRSQVSGLASGFSLLKYASVAAGIGIGEEFVRGVFKAGGEMQRMQATLVALNTNQRVANPLGAARASMAWMQSFGMGPGASMSFPDIMKGYQLAKESGINPEKNLTALADLAAARNVPLNRVIVAVNDAMMGGTTRPLKMLGISMRRDRGKGGGASFDYSTIGGKDVTEHVSGGPQKMLSEIIKLSNIKYQGIALGMAKTMPGGIAQLQKLLYLFQARIAGSGVMDWAMGQINRLLTFVNKASRSGALDRWAKSISDFMVRAGNKLIAFVTSTNWTAVGKDLVLVGTAIGAVAKALAQVSTVGGGGISGLVNLFIASKVFGFTRAILGLVAPLGEIALALGGVSVATLPITATITAIALLAGGAFLLRRNWSGVGAWWAQMWAGMKAAVPSPTQLVPKGYVAGPQGRLIPTRMVTAGNLAGGSGALVRFPVGPGGRMGHQAEPLAARRSAAGAGTGGRSFDGHMTIEVVGQPNAIQVRKMRAIGGTIDLTRGPIRTGG